MNWFEVARSRLGIKVSVDTTPNLGSPKVNHDQQLIHTTHNRVAYVIDLDDCVIGVRVVDGEITGQLDVTVSESEGDFTRVCHMMGWGEFDARQVPRLRDVVIDTVPSNVRVRVNRPNSQSSESVTTHSIDTNTVLRFMVAVNIMGSSLHTHTYLFLEFEWRAEQLTLTHLHAHGDESTTTYILASSGYYRIQFADDGSVNIRCPNGQQHTTWHLMQQPLFDCNIQGDDPVAILTDLRTVFTFTFYRGQVLVSRYHGIANPSYFSLHDRFMTIQFDRVVIIIDCAANQPIGYLTVDDGDRVLAYDAGHRLLLLHTAYGIVGHRNGEIIRFYESTPEQQVYMRYHYWYPKNHLLTVGYDDMVVNLRVGYSD